MALADKALVGCALWAKTVAEEVPETANHEGRVALARAVVAGRYDVRVKEYLVAFFNDDDTTAQGTVSGHCTTILETFQKLGLS